MSKQNILSRKLSHTIKQAEEAVLEKQEAEVPGVGVSPEPELAESFDAVDAAEDNPALAEVTAQLAAMREQMSALQKEQAAERERLRSDEDDLVYLARRNGIQWAERKVVNKQYVDVSFSITAFYGPFADLEAAQKYLAHKHSRPDGKARWADVEPVTGEERRVIRRNERRDAEAAGANDIPTL